MKELWVGEQIGLMRYVWLKGENGNVRNFQIRNSDLSHFTEIMQSVGVKVDVYSKEKWIEQNDQAGGII